MVSLQMSSLQNGQPYGAGQSSQPNQIINPVPSPRNSLLAGRSSFCRTNPVVWVPIPDLRAAPGRI